MQSDKLVESKGMW